MKDQDAPASCFPAPLDETEVSVSEGTTTTSPSKKPVKEQLKCASSGVILEESGLSLDSCVNDLKDDSRSNQVSSPASKGNVASPSEKPFNEKLKCASGVILEEDGPPSEYFVNGQRAETSANQVSSFGAIALSEGTNDLSDVRTTTNSSQARSFHTQRNLPGAYENQPGGGKPTLLPLLDLSLLRPGDDSDITPHDNREELVEARAVTDEESARPTAVAVDSNRNNEESLKDRALKECTSWKGATVCLGLVVFLVVVVSLSLVTKEENQDPDLPALDEIPPKEVLLDEALPSKSIQKAQDNPSSPQARAWVWLLQDPSLLQYPQRRIQQRFALGTIYYALNNPNGTARPWFRDSGWLDYTIHECEWFNNPTDTFLRRARPATSPCAGSDGQWYTHLWLGNNSLVGTLPIEEVCLLTSLESIVMALNNVHGTLFDPCLLELQDLKEIDFHARRDWKLTNEISGTIMTEIGLMNSLKDIVLGGLGNKLHGTIPSEIGSLSNLNTLGLSNSPLTGTIPVELFHLPNLTILGLAGTGLTGSLPTEMGLLTSLMYTYLWRGQLTGTLPTELGKLKRLSWFHAYGNRFSGAIPSEVGNMPKLRELRLSSNALTSSVPSELGNASSLTRLEASSNKLTGAISSELGRLQLLRVLALNNNQLTGNLPSELGSLGSTEVIDLSHNVLEGALPTELGSLASVKELNLSNNAISQQLPTELGLLSTLVELDLANNELSGPMPVELSGQAWPNIVFLNLSSNALLSGTIPNDLCLALNATETTFLGFDCSLRLCGCDYCACKPNPLD